MSSKALQLRTAIKTLIVESETVALTAEDIFIQRQHDLLVEIETAVAGISGVALTILPVAARMNDPEASDLDLDADVELTLFCNPITTDTPEDPDPEEEIHEEMIKLLHKQVIEGVHRDEFWQEELQLVRWDDVPDPEYLRRRTVFRTRMVL